MDGVTAKIHYDEGVIALQLIPSARSNNFYWSGILQITFDLNWIVRFTNLHKMGA